MTQQQGIILGSYCGVFGVCCGGREILAVFWYVLAASPPALSSKWRGCQEKIGDHLVASFTLVRQSSLSPSRDTLAKPGVPC